MSENKPKKLPRPPSQGEGSRQRKISSVAPRKALTVSHGTHGQTEGPRHRKVSTVSHGTNGHPDVPRQKKMSSIIGPTVRAKTSKHGRDSGLSLQEIPEDSRAVSPSSRGVRMSKVSGSKHAPLSRQASLDGIEHLLSGMASPLSLSEEPSYPVLPGANLTPEMRARRARVLSGDLRDLPPLRSKIVRIFLSSTFTDMGLERNTLLEKVNPELKEYCREVHGLDFQVVDMRWGIRDEATDDHMTTHLCMKEIDNCKRLSVGPNFVAFLGQKYGYRPIPTQVKAGDFEKLHGAVMDTPAEAELLRQWYHRDDNAIPPIYILQPISSILKHFNDKNKPELQRDHQNEWWDILGKLQRIMRKAAKILRESGVFTKEHIHHYSMSVTEREVRKGILDATGDVSAHCLAYVRRITDINLQDPSNKARFFVDVTQGCSVDEEAQDLLSDLRDHHLTNKLHQDNIHNFEAEWLEPNGLDPEHHASYLAEFASNFQKNVTRMIDDAVATNKDLSSDPVYEETLQHLHACTSFVQYFQGRQDIIDKIRAYVTDQSNEPLIIFGQSGCGKTSLLAKGYSMISDWMSDAVKPITMLRFLGTSPDSSTIIPTLKSLCQQIAANYEDTNSKTEKMPEDISPLIQLFKRSLAVATSEKPLLIFLDSLDQLSQADGAHALGWLPNVLPPHVKIVLSTAILEDTTILDTLKKLVRNDTSFVEVFQLGEDLGVAILNTWLANENRKVTDEQWKVIRPALANCNLPLFIKLVFDEVVNWKSYSPKDSTVLYKTVQDSIMSLFNSLEKQHGKVMVSHALMYLTASKSGLSENELEDLLSLDEQVLNDVYQYHLPPVRRIPPLLWTRIRGEIPNYLTERESDDTHVIGWYHRQFHDTARYKYFKNVNNLKDTHSALADYFLGIWGGKPKPFVYSEMQRQRFGLQDAEGECDRIVSDQPNYYTDDATGKILHYNLRKLNELPFHLIRSDRKEDLYEEVLFNFKWLHAKLSCMTLSSIVADFDDALQHCYDREVQLVVDALRLGSFILQNYPNMLGSQLIARLVPYHERYSKIRKLLQQCDQDGLSANALVPAYHCEHTPGGPLQFSLEGHTRATFGLVFNSDGTQLFTVSNLMLIWDVTTGESVKKINPGINGLMRNLSLSKDDKIAACCTNTNQLIIFSILSGEFKIIDNPVDGSDGIAGTAVADEFVIVITKSDVYRFDFHGRLVNKYGIKQPDRFYVRISLTPSENLNLVLRTEVECSGGLDSDEEHSEENKVESSKEIQELHGRMCIQLHTEILQLCNNIKDTPMRLVSIESKESECTVESAEKYIKETFEFDGPMVFNKEESRIYVCNNTEAEDKLELDEEAQDIVWRFKPSLISCYEKVDSGWKFVDDIGKTAETVFYLCVSPDENLVAATHVYGYRVWNRKLKKRFDLNLPQGLRNIPNRKRSGRLVAFTNNSKYIVTAVREKIYVWSAETGVLKKILDAHVKRIIALMAIPGENKMISSSFDTSIKVWNFDNILERMFPLDRHEKKIESLCVAADAPTAVTTTRSSVGVWNLETGRLEKVLVAGSHTTLVTKAILTSDGEIAITGESGYVYFWNVNSGEIIYKDKHKSVQQFLLIEKDTRVLTLSRESNNRGLCICRQVPSGQQLYKFDFQVNKLKDMVLTSDLLYVIVPALAEDGQHILKQYHARTGTHLYDITLTHDNFKDFSHIVALPNNPTYVALIDPEKAVIWDVKKQVFLRSIKGWNGICTKDGHFGLLAPNTGGLYLMDLKKGKTSQRQLLPRVNEGSFLTKAIFVNQDKYVLYYHGGKNLVKLIRLSDGALLAEYHIRGEGIRLFQTRAGGTMLVLAIASGSVLTLLLSDPKNPSSTKTLAALPSRGGVATNTSTLTQPNGTSHSETTLTPSPSESSPTKKNIDFRTAVRITMKAKQVARSKACVIS